MIVRLLFSFLVSATTGILLVELLWPRRADLPGSRSLKWSLGVCLGLGLSAEIYFLGRCLGTASVEKLGAADLVLLGVVAAGFFVSRRRAASSAPGEVSSPKAALPQTRLVRYVLAAAFALTLLIALQATLRAFRSEPNGQWDAWMSWNLRARFFFRGGEHWREAFSNLFWGANPSYPVLLPSMVARAWTYAGSETALAPALIAAVFTFATVSLASAGLRVLRSRGQGLMAGLLLLGTPFFIDYGTSQTADVPLGFFLLATLVLFCSSDAVSRAERGLLFLAGISAGLAVGIKNEGLLFLLACLAGTALVPGGRERIVGRARGLAAFALGFLIVLPIPLYAKLRLAPPDPLLLGVGERLHQLVEWRRYVQILVAFAGEGLSFGRWPLQLTPLLVFYALLLGAEPGKSWRRGALVGISSVALILGGYFCIFLISPEDLAWHLRTTVNRLFLQLWPSVLFLLFLRLRTPEQAAADGEGGRAAD